MSKNKLVILEINNDWLKIAEITSSNKGIILNKLAAKKTDLEEGQIKNNLIELIKNSKIKTKKIITYIPRYLLTVRNIELPSVNKDELKNMVSLQIVKETPYSRDEIIYDYKVLGSDKEGYSKVMIVIIRKEIVESYINMLKLLGLQIERISLGCEGIQNWYVFNNISENEVNTSIVCDIDSNFTDFNIISKNVLVFSRSISIGANQLIGDSGMWQKKFVDEVVRSINIYNTEELGLDFDEFILTGANYDFHGLISAIEAEFSIPIRVEEGFKKIMFSKYIQDFSDEMKTVSFNSLIGIGSQVEPLCIDLIPDEEKLGQDMEAKAKEFTITGAILIILLVIVLGIAYKKINDKALIVNKLKYELEKTDEAAQKIELMMRKNEQIVKRNKQKESALNVLIELYSVVPNEIYFSSVNFDGQKDRQVILRGSSSAMSHIFKFVTTLENLKYFTKVKTKYTTKRRLKNKELTDFEIICPLS